MAGEEGKGLVEAIGRAIIDPEFRDRIKSDPTGVAADYGLAQRDTNALIAIDHGKLDEAAKGVGGRADWTIGIGISGHFDTK